MHTAEQLCFMLNADLNLNPCIYGAFPGHQHYIHRCSCIAIIPLGKQDFLGCITSKAPFGTMAGIWFCIRPGTWEPLPDSAICTLHEIDSTDLGWKALRREHGYGNMELEA